MSLVSKAILIGLVATNLSNNIDGKQNLPQIDQASHESRTEQGSNVQKERQARNRNETELTTSKVLDILPTRNFSTVVGVIHTLGRAVGKNESEAKLQGVFGHAFSFEMEEGAGDVWQEENLDYKGLFLKMTSLLGYRFQRFEAKQRDNQGDFQTLKTNAWKAVQASINQGVPAIAWQPMSREQKAAGLRAGAWGLLVGYNKSDKTYTVRHQYHKKGKEAYTVRYDAIGHTDPIEWFHVLIYNGSVPVDTLATHVMALRNAIAFANGTRWKSEQSIHKANAQGLAAFEMWRTAIESGVAKPKHTLNHARELANWRLHAATYLQELTTTFPSARSQLEVGAGHYIRLIETAKKLQAFCEPFFKAQTFPNDARIKVSTHVTTMMQDEKNAIQAITRALELLGKSN